jgi:hypothetical protein
VSSFANRRLGIGRYFCGLVRLELFLDEFHMNQYDSEWWRDFRYFLLIEAKDGIVKWPTAVRH